ncbi:MAG: flagellar hook-length control protein FliK [Deltaproteobacteria bacterium]
MQGASILAATRAVETDNSRNSYSGAATVSDRDLFKNCLKKQTRQLDQTNGQPSSSNGQGESKSGKLDRSALLKSPGSSNVPAKTAEEPAAPDGDTVILSTVSDTIQKTDPSQAPDDHQVNDGAKTMGSSSQITDQTSDSASSQADVSLPVPAGIASLAGIAAPTAPQQPEMELSLASGDKPGIKIDSTITGNVSQVEVDPSAEMVQSVPQNELAVGSQVPLTEADACSVQSQPIQTTPVIPVGETQKVPAETLTVSLEKKAEVRRTETSTDKAGSPEDVQTPSVFANPSLHVNSSAEQETSNTVTEAVLASAIPVTDKHDMIAQDTVQPLSGEASQPEVELVSNTSAVPVSAENPDSVKDRSEGKTTDDQAPAVSVTDKPNSKIAVEVLKAMAGKIEESEGKNSEPTEKSADKKDNNSGTGLKKLMEFESGRLQAVRLNRESVETKSSDPKSDNGQTLALTQTADVKAAGEVNKTLVSDLSSKSLVDVKNIIDQVVQKAELTVKANTSEMKIQLEPEFLGKMTIKIALEDGLLTARFTTDNHQVKQILDNNMASLRQSLEAQGIRVEKTEVNVQLDSGGTFGGYQEGRQELWQRPDNPGYQHSANLDAGTYSMPNDDQLVEAAFIPSEVYGVQADGSMNFIV